ncbi:MAG TPA: hypothetical protein VD993_14155 [Chitinophagaceae bacterium]|nr:hypothetical protein [Chitinophagaceae bacterium]
MKHNLSLKSLCGLAVLVLMTSCVAKRKYVDAQNTITQLQTENAQLRETGTTMQTNITSLEANNRSLQARLDSTNSWASGQQTRWNSFQAFYDEGTRTTEQVHQQLHQQMDDLIGAENITTSGGRIYVTLAEKTLFASGSSKLTAKGEQVLAQLAQTIKDNPNVEIDIASVPGYYTNGMNGTAMSTDMNNNTTTDANNQNMNNTDTKVKVDDDLKIKDGDTKIKMDKDGDVKVKTDGSKQKSSTARTNGNGYTKKSATRSYSGTARKSEGKSKTYSSSPARKKSASAGSTWSLNMARSTSIAKKLVDEGVAKSRILVNNTSANGEGNTKKDFQVIISPKSDTYYNELGNGTSGSTNGSGMKQ